MNEPFWKLNETGKCLYELSKYKKPHKIHQGHAIEDILTPIERSVKLGLCNGFRQWVTHGPPTEEFTEKVLSESEFLIVDFWAGTRILKPWIESMGKTEQEFYDYHTKMLKKMAEKYGDRFFWSVTGEPFSVHPNFPTEQFSSKKEAREFCMHWLKGNSPARDPESKLRWYDQLQKHNVDIRKHNIAIQLGLSFASHYAYELGSRLVWVECNCGLAEGLQQTIAFVRGAANQYRSNKTYWGIDPSPWNDRSGTCLWYDKNGQRVGGLTESLMLREWVYTYLAGANLLLEETSDMSNWLWYPKPYAKLSPLGKQSARLGKFTKTFDRGKPYRPVAVMLEHDHGWERVQDDADSNVVWQGTVPTKRADMMIGHFFDIAFPGHCDYYKQQADRFCEKPWATVGEFVDRVASGEDMRKHEAGRLATSRWGDVIDVVLEDCPDDVLADYKVLILLGELKVNAKLLKRLRQFVMAGGTLVVNSTHFFSCPEDLLESSVSHGTNGKTRSLPSIRKGKISPDAEKFLGLSFTGEKLRGSMSHFYPGDKHLFDKGLIFDKVKPTTATPIASCVNWLWGREPDVPLEQTPTVVERKLGKGRVITTLPYFMMHPVTRTSLNISSLIYDHAINETLPYKVEGEAIQYLFNETENGYIVSMFNNDDKNWKGHLVSHSKPGKTRFEWNKRGDTKWGRDGKQWKLSVTLPKYSFKIIVIDNPKH